MMRRTFALWFRLPADAARRVAMQEQLLHAAVHRVLANGAPGAPADHGVRIMGSAARRKVAFEQEMVLVPRRAAAELITTVLKRPGIGRALIHSRTR